MNKVLTISILFDAFKQHIESLESTDVVNHRNAKRYFKQAIFVNQNLINETVNEIKRANKTSAIDLLDLFDVYSLFLYNVADKLEELSESDALDFIEYMKNYKKKEVIPEQQLKLSL